MILKSKEYSFPGLSTLGICVTICKFCYLKSKFLLFSLNQFILKENYLFYSKEKAQYKNDKNKIVLLKL